MKELYNPLSINFYDVELRNLIEEYITHQKTEFTLKARVHMSFIGLSKTARLLKRRV